MFETGRAADASEVQFAINALPSLEHAIIQRADIGPMQQGFEYTVTFNLELGSYKMAL